MMKHDAQIDFMSLRFPNMLNQERHIVVAVSLTNLRHIIQNI